MLSHGTLKFLLQDKYVRQLSEGVHELGCTVAGARLAGNYSRRECGLEFRAEARHRGLWLCELEKYHLGFSRRCGGYVSRQCDYLLRYGEVRYGQILLSVATVESSFEPPSTSLASTTVTTMANTREMYENMSISKDVDENIPELEQKKSSKDENYQRKFQILRVWIN